MSDLRLALRQFMKHPGFTAVAVLTLALGIGANTAIFSVFNAVILRPLPYRSPEQLVWIFGNYRRMGYERIPPNWANELFSEMMDRGQSFEQWARLKGKRFILQKPDGAEQIRGMRVSSHLFEMLGVQPILGRAFLPEENELGRHRVVILSYECWQRRFGGDREVLNRRVQLIDAETSDRTAQPHDTLQPQSYAIIGVLPPRWAFPMGATPENAGFFSHGAEMWEPESLTADEKQRRAVLDLIIARLKPTVSYQQARAESELLFKNLRKPSDSIDGVELLALKRQVAGQALSTLPLLLGATGLVLLLACANVANLLLARATAREKEFAIRAALGAGRIRVIRQLLSESIVLAVIGGGCGWLLAWWGVRGLAALTPGHLPRLPEAGLDRVVLAFALVVTLAAGVAFGLAPAWRAARTRLNATLMEAGRGLSAGFRRQHLRRLLVVSEIALSLVLLVGAALLMNSFIRLLRIDPGYRAEGVLTAPLSFLHPKYATNAAGPWAEPSAGMHQAAGRFVEQLLERVAALAGVQCAAVTSWIPVEGGRDRFSAGFHLEGGAPPDVANMSFVTADYFKVMAIPLLRGRYFTKEDLAPNAPGARIVSESFARKHFPGGDALGRRFVGGVGGAGEIVGIVKDTLEAGLDARAEPHIYHAAMPEGGGVLVLRTQGDVHHLAGAVRQEMMGLDPDQGLLAVRPMTQILADSIAERRFQTLLLGLFSVAALLLAVIGLYGLMAYVVSQSSRQIGVRMALGAQKSDVLRLVLAEGLKLVMAGLLIGVGAGLALTRILRHQLFGVTASDPATFLSVAALLAAVAVLACYLPARRATMVDPMEALRCE